MDLKVWENLIVEKNIDVEMIFEGGNVSNPLIKCMVYIGLQNKPTNIQPDYLSLVLESAKSVGIDEEYINNIKK